MKKRLIRVVKRDAEDILPPEPSAAEIVIQQQKEDDADERDMVQSVKGWITERRKNNADEEKDAADSLFAWDGDPVVRSR